MLVRGLDLFGRDREMRRRWGRKQLLFKFDESNYPAISYPIWELRCCQALCSAAVRLLLQPVTAASKRRRAGGGILSSGAQFVEIQE